MTRKEKKAIKLANEVKLDRSMERFKSGAYAKSLDQLEFARHIKMLKEMGNTREIKALTKHRKDTIKSLTAERDKQLEMLDNGSNILKSEVGIKFSNDLTNLQDLHTFAFNDNFKRAKTPLLNYTSKLSA